METPQDVTRMRLVGGNLALDLVNSRSGPPDGPPDDDALHGYPDLVAWAQYAGAVTQAEADALLERARQDPGGARTAFATALRTRDYLDDCFRSLAAGRPPEPQVLALLRDDESTALAHATLALGDGAQWTWEADTSLERPLRPVVHAAVELLAAGALDRVKQCGGCRFLFHDESRNRSRRWCSMEDCGTSEKVRRYVAARRARTVR